MKNAISAHMLILAVIILSGCATAKQATEVYSHTPYDPPAEIPKKIVIDMPFEEAWNHLVESLATNFFAVDQIDKASRFISINASRDAGGIGRDNDWWLEYASCGNSKRVISFKDKEYSFNYPTIGTKAYDTVYSNNSYSYWDAVSPRVDVEIKMNIYMSPVSSGQTEMSVNARYHFTQYLDGKRHTLRRNGEYLSIGPITDTRGTVISLTTQNSVKHPSDQEPPIFCYATGKFENAVLSLAK